jgi:hypothetical protein
MMLWKLQSRENHQVFEFGGLGLTEYPLCPTLTRRFPKVRTFPRWEKGQRNPYPQTDRQPAPCVHFAPDVIVCTWSKIALHYTRQKQIATQTLNGIPNIDLATSGQGGLFIVFRSIIEYRSLIKGF